MANLEVKNVSFHSYWESPSVKNISLTVPDDQVICLVGPAGSGKTTLLRLIAGLLKPDSGVISMDNYDITTMPIYERRIGFIPQNPSLLPHLNVIDNIIFAIREKKDNGVHTALTLLEQMNMKHLAHMMPESLSYGQQQNISILRAIASNPKIMLFDEPYAHFEGRNRDNFIEESLRLIRQTKCYKIIVTHSPQEALLYSDYIYVMNNGVIEQYGSSEQLYQYPRNLFVAKLFGALNHFRVKLKDRIIETPLGRIPNELNKTYKEAEILIRPSDISVYKLRVANTIQAKVLDKKFLPEGSYYVVSISNSDIAVKVISKASIKIGETVFLKMNRYHLLGY